MILNCNNSNNNKIKFLLYRNFLLKPLVEQAKK